MLATIAKNVSLSFASATSFEFASTGPLSLAGAPPAVYLGVLVGWFASAAMLFLWMLRRHREQTRGEYETRVVDLEATFRATEENLRTDARAAVNWNAQARALKGDLAQLAKERDELRKVHPKYHRLTFNIGVIGRRGTGKTGLCLRLTDPLFHDLNTTQTSPRGVIYEHPVVTSVNKQTATRTEHYFKFVEWGGEYMIEAQNDLLRLCDPGRSQEGEGATARVGVQALILVVDLTAPEEIGDKQKGAPLQINETRIREQIDQHFDQASLKFIINSTLKTYLQTVVVFINKVDVLLGSPKEQEEEARRRYNDLLVNVSRVYPHVHVIVGSVSTDAGLLKLYSHLVERILPEEVKRQRPLGRGQDLDICGGEQDGAASASDPAASSASNTPRLTTEHSFSNQDAVN